jgi:hypothetical protein
VDLDTGERKILKLSFFETFEATIGKLKIPCYRHPEKEGAVLELVGDHPNFMHGSQYIDTKGNNVRVLDIVKGVNFYRYIESINMDHERYFHELLPDILKKLVSVFDALRFLHKSGFRHGDVRNDHIFIEETTGNYVLIDFDYDFDLAGNPFSLDIMGVGNILLYAVGKGFHNLKERTQGELVYEELMRIAVPDDFSIIHKWRFMNLKKLYPYIPDGLNDILGHFTQGAEIFYESVGEVLVDLNKCIRND